MTQGTLLGFNGLEISRIEVDVSAKKMVTSESGTKLDLKINYLPSVSFVLMK